MEGSMHELEHELGTVVRQVVATAGTITEYREPLVGFARAADPRFRTLRESVSPIHLMPEDLVLGAQTVLSFFLPFARWVVEANTRDREHGRTRAWPSSPGWAALACTRWSSPTQDARAGSAVWLWMQRFLSR
jgi:hypothetical protein